MGSKQSVDRGRPRICARRWPPSSCTPRRWPPAAHPPDKGLADGLQAVAVGQLGGAVDDVLLAVVCDCLEHDRGRGGDEVEVVLALQALLQGQQRAGWCQSFRQGARGWREERVCDEYRYVRG